MRNAIGLIETVGLAGAIDAADAAVKSANVELVGMEYTKGDGMVVIKIEGNVGAVQAGIEAARQSASKVCRVFSYKVIPRPSEQLEMFLPEEIEEVHEVEVFEEEVIEETIEEVIEEAVEESVEETLPETETVEEQVIEVEAEVIEDVIEETETVIEEVEKVDDAPIKLIEDEKKKDEVTCNICKDPRCTRIKGDLKRFCIHYFDRK